MYEITDENEKLGNMPTTNPFGQSVIFHMERCGLTTDLLADRSGMGVNTINKMRSGKKVKLETVLAFCVALELEETFRVGQKRKGKTPTCAKLIAFAEPFVKMCDITLYNNGFALYENGIGRHSVVWLPYCVNFTYSSPHNYLNTPAEQNQPWQSSVVISEKADLIAAGSSEKARTISLRKIGRYLI